MKKLVANRVPPGDRWVMIDDEADIIYGSLTDCLNQVFLVHQITQFFIDAVSYTHLTLPTTVRV